jgi:hypothetical protein
MRFVRLALLLLVSVVPTVQGQSVLYRPPNLLSTWVPPAGEIQFNFIHRFRVLSDQSGHKVVNFPTFTLAPGLGHGIAVGVLYGTNSTLIRTPFRPNEAEFFGRVRFGAAEGEEGFAVAITPSWNTAARSFDSELAAEYNVGRFTLLGAARYATNALDSDSGRAALAGGVSIRVTRLIAISGDLGAFVSPSAKAAWSVGLDLVIPGSPHTLALEVSNVTVSTIQGNSIGGNQVLYGFEFTIPIRLSTFTPWFHG